MTWPYKGILLAFNVIFILIDNTVSKEFQNCNHSFEFFQIANKLFHERNITHNILSQVQLIRIPKASSTSLSVIARRIVGCSPPGPCCKYPGTPIGSCSDRLLFQCQSKRKVIGCTGHTPDYVALKSDSIHTMTMIREPISRSLSAFFYPGIHHNSDCQDQQPQRSTNDCFLEYLKSNIWQNIVVKTFTGAYSYANANTCKQQKECRHSLELALTNLKYFHFIGIAELWELSLLLLYRKFPGLPPQLTDFELNERSSSGSNINTISTTSSKVVYNITFIENFKQHAIKHHMEELFEQNRYDVILYKESIRIFCQDLHAFGLWNFPIVRNYWKEKLTNITCETTLAAH